MADHSQISVDKPMEDAADRDRRQQARRFGPLALPLAIIFASGLYLAINNMLIPSSDPFATATKTASETGGSGIGDSPAVVGDLPPEQAGVPSPKPSDPRWAMLLLGYGGGAHDGAYLTDSMMLAIVDPRQKTLALLSIPRDSWVPLLFDGKTAVYSKLNTAYAYAIDQSQYRDRLPRYSGKQGAGSFVVDTVARLTGVAISNYLALDFAGFREMIDTVGGIDVRINESFTASYPANDDPNIDPSWTTVRFAKGLEHMGGQRAIAFARAREVLDNYNEGTDFARSRRQRTIMEAFKNRLFEPSGMVRLPQLLAIVPKHVDTDYAVPNLGQLTQLLMDWNDLRIYQTALTQDNFLQVATGPGGAYVLVPQDDRASWSPVRAFMRRLWEQPATAVEIANTRIVVRNNSGVDGAGGRLSEFLRGMGYRVAVPASGTSTYETRLIDRSGGKGGLVIDQLVEDLGISIPVVVGEASNPSELILELGRSNSELALLKPHIDPTAPSSAAGIQALGTWAPAPADDDSAAESPGQGSPSASRTPRRSTTATAYGTTTPLPYSSPRGTASTTPTPTRGGSFPGTSTATPTLWRTSTPLVRTSPTPTPSPRATAPTASPTPSRTPTVRPAATATPVR